MSINEKLNITIECDCSRIEDVEKLSKLLKDNNVSFEYDYEVNFNYKNILNEVKNRTEKLYTYNLDEIKEMCSIAFLEDKTCDILLERQQKDEEIRKKQRIEFLESRAKDLGIAKYTENGKLRLTNSLSAIAKLEEMIKDIIKEIKKNN